MSRGASGRVVWLGGFAIAYFLAVCCGRTIAAPGSAMGAAWPGAGLAIAILSRRGLSLWPALLLSSCLASLCWMPLAPHPVLGMASIGIGATLQAVAGSLLLRKLDASLDPLASALSFLRFLATAVIAGLVSPTISGVGLSMAGAILPAQFFDFWSAGWRGNVTGILICAPLCFALSGPRRKERVGGRTEFWAVQICVALFGATIFGPLFGIGTRHIQIGFLGVAFLVWAALRIGELGFALAMANLATFTLWGTAHGYGPFTRSGAEGAAQVLQVFLTVASATGWILTATFAERTRLAARLRLYTGQLESLVQERTASLRRAQESLASAQAIAHIGSWERDFRTGGLHGSDELYRILGLDPNNGGGADVTAFIHPDDVSTVTEARRRATAGAEPISLEYRIRRADGKVRHVREHLATQQIPDGPTAVLGTVQDLTQYKQLEEQLRQSQKMEAIGRLAGGVAHDFNNLLTVIHCNGAVLRDDLGCGVGREEIDEILKAAERAAKLTNQLLAFSRRQVLRMTVLDLNAIVADMEPMLRRLIGEHIQLTIAVDHSPACIRADRGQLEQVVMNLAVNARDAMPSGGSLHVEVSTDWINAAKAGAAVPGPGHYTILSVTDTGVGIAPEALPHIFEPFYTTKSVGEGTGLGLSMVYGIVQQSGGGIAVESQSGRGTTFRAYFPAVHEGPREEPCAAPEVLALRGSERVLLVEDEAGVRNLVRSILRSSGYEVFDAASGSAALKLSKELDSVRLLITDVIMPGINGTELARALCEVYAGLRVLYISGYTGDMLPAEVLASTASGAFLPKPFTPETLGRAVRELLDGPGCTAPESR